MAQAGYSFPRREDAITHFLATSGASEGNMLVTEEEIQVRLADIECDRAMKFTEDRSRWERAVFEEWLERTGAQWTELDGRVSSVVAQLERMDG